MLPQHFESSTEFFDYLEQGLSQLSTLKQLAFITAIGERMLPLYADFSYKESWGSVDVCRKALDAIWDYISGKPMSPQHLSHLQADCEKVLLTSSEECSNYAEYALKFSQVLMNILYYPVEQDVHSLLEVCTHAIDTMDIYIQNDDEDESLGFNRDTTWEEYWKRHPVLINEQNNQLKDLAILKQEALTPKLVQQIKTASVNSPIIPIKSSLQSNCFP